MPDHQMSREIIQCVIDTKRLGLTDLLNLRGTCRSIHAEITGKLPNYLKYVLSDAKGRGEVVDDQHAKDQVPKSWPCCP